MATSENTEQDKVKSFNIPDDLATKANLLSAIIESSEDAILSETLDGKISSWNKGAERLYGYSAEEAIGQPVLMLISKEHVGELFQSTDTIKKGNVVSSYDTIRVRKDGTSVDVSISISPINDSNSNVVGMASIAHNISDRKQTFKYARSLIEASQDPLVTISPEGKITDVNEATIKVTGVDRQVLIGTDFSDYFTEPQKAHDGYAKAFKIGFVTDYPLTIKSKEGKLTDVLYNASVYKDESGNVLGIFAAARDVTASKQALFYARSVIEAGIDAMSTISPEGKITDVNGAMERITGVKREKLIGSDFVNYFTDKEEAEQGYQQVFKEGTIRDYSLTLRNISGELIDVLFNASVYKDDKDNVFGVIITIRDVTEEKKAEEKLHEASAYARSLIEASLDPLFIISPEGKITGVNGATEKITGVTREWLIDTDFANYFTDPHKAQAGYRKVLKEGLVRDYPLSIHFASGNTTDVSFNASVYKDATGEVRGIFAVARDVTESKKISQHTRSLIESSLDPLVSISPIGKITDVNEAAIKVTGVKRELLIGTDFSDYFTEPKKAKEGYEKAFKLGFVKDYPLTIKSIDGTLTDVLYNASVYKNDEGKIIGITASARDYTLAKKETEEATKANKEMEAFSYSVSHDLRSPLRAIDGFTQILEDTYSEKLDEEGKRITSIIRKSTEKMGKLIDDLLSFSHLGRQEIKKDQVNMKLLVGDIYKELTKNTPNNKIEFVLNDIPYAMADRNMMSIVWTNLISNAIKFTGKKDKPKIEIGSKVDGNTITYYQKDNGAGFDMKYVDKLFGVFQRLHSSEEFDGTGVGLANVKRVIERHGGKVWADSKVDEGATFYFTLPKE